MNQENNLCEYGCGLPGLFFKEYKHKPSKWVCSDNIQHCPVIKQKKSESVKLSKLRLKQSGKQQEISIKAVQTRKQNGIFKGSKKAMLIADQRKNNGSYATGGIKAAYTKMNTIDITTGLSIAKLGGQKGGITRKNTIDNSTGLSISKTSSIKGIETRHKQDENGLSSYDRGQLKAMRCKPWNNSLLFYGSSYEKDWLDYIASFMGEEWVIANIKRGPVVTYYDFHTKIDRRFNVDFQFENILVEIKSDYIFKRNRHELHKNIQKLDTISKTKDIYLVINHEEYLWNKQRNFIINKFELF